MSTEIKLKDATTNLDIMKDGLVLGNDGTPDARIEQLYDNALVRDGLDPKVLRQYQQHRNDFLANASFAFGTQGIDVMKEHTDVQNLTVKIPMGMDTSTLSLDRSRETSDGKGGRMEHGGYLTIGYTTRGAEGSSGELKKVREQLKQLGSGLLGK